MFQKAKVEHVISEDVLEKMHKLDQYLQTRFRLAFGNRIIKQMYDFIPVYVACGGTELGGMDYIIAIIAAMVVYDTLDRIFEAYRERRVRRAARHHRLH